MKKLIIVVFSIILTIGCYVVKSDIVFAEDIRRAGM